MLISEIYSSRQGEGLLTGTPSIFIRTSGCNLRCDFCDTPYASWDPTGRKMSIQLIYEEVVRLGECFEDLKTIENGHLGKIKHVVITGGEPMLPREMVELCESLQRAKFHITIETAGTIFRQLKCDLMSISPKFSNSTPTLERAGQWRARHERTRFQPEIVRAMIDNYDFQLKFVVNSPTDIEEITAYLDLIKHPPSAKEYVLLMPEGVDQQQLQEKANWLEPLCRHWGFTYCPRRHIEWYGNRRGT